MWQAMEALEAIQGRFHWLLAWHQLTHGSSAHGQANMTIRDPISCARACTQPGGWRCDDIGRDNMRRATEAWTATPGLFHRLLVWWHPTHASGAHGQATMVIGNPISRVRYIIPQKSIIYLQLRIGEAVVLPTKERTP